MTNKINRSYACQSKNVQILEKSSSGGVFFCIAKNMIEKGGDIVNIGLHFFLKNVRPYAASCSEA